MQNEHQSSHYGWVVCRVAAPGQSFLVLTFCINSTRGEGATSLHAGLERLGKETGEPTGTFGSHPLTTLTSTERSLRRFKRSHR